MNKPKRPTLCWIPVNKLFVDRENYQRDLRKSTLAKFDRDGWDWDACGVLVVSARPDGRYAIADGSHRFTKAVEWAIPELPCYVAASSTLSEEARIFCRINRNRADTNAYELLRGLAAAGDKDALRIAALVEKHGFKLSNFTGLDNLAASSALMSAYDSYGAECLDRALWVLRHAWAGDPKGSSGIFIQGLARFVYYVELDDKRLGEFAERLSMKRPSDVKRAFPESVSSAVLAAALAFLSVHNAGRRNGKVEPSIFDRPVSASRAAQKRWGSA